jgi:hypothetical protein
MLKDVENSDFLFASDSAMRTPLVARTATRHAESNERELNSRVAPVELSGHFQSWQNP